MGFFPSIVRKQAETVTTWVVKQLLDRWGVAIVSTVFLAAIPFIKGARDLLWAFYAVPGWSIVLAAWITLSVVVTSWSTKPGYG